MLPTLHGPRITLRSIEPSDSGALFELFGDPTVTRFWGFATLRDPSDVEELLRSIHEGAASGTLLQWGIVSNDGGPLIGTVTLAAVDRDHRRAELGVALRPASEGRGYAREAARIVLDYGFNELALHRVVADVDPRNVSSIRLLERLGFRYEGRLREHYFQSGEWQDGEMFGLLSEEWRAGDDRSER
jgi:[ribosomal protein S5]-alanine N-acetyltransferase